MIYFQKAKSNPNRLDKKKHVNSLVIFFIAKEKTLYQQ
jgi:hypothetical protein